MVRVMEELKVRGLNGTQREKDRGMEAEALQGEIFNTSFVVRLSYLTDVYDVFGYGVNCLQVT